MKSDEDLRQWLDQCRRQRGAPRKAREEKPLGQALAEWISSSGLAKRHALKDIYAAWQEAVGKDASHCRITAVKRGVVHVLVDSAACLHELANFRKKEILAGLQKHKEIGNVYDIEFRLGTLEQQ